jgi:hypothetical protein
MQRTFYFSVSLFVALHTAISAEALTGLRIQPSKRNPNYIFTTNTTITAANSGTYTNKNWTINTGVTVTIDHANTMTIKSLTMVGTAVLTHTSCSTTNPCPKISLNIDGNVTIPTNASINANARGYRGSYMGNPSVYGMTDGNINTGGSQKNAGGSHGGYGGYSTTVPTAIPANTYGSVTQPTTFGGGGGGQSLTHRGANGGGAIYLNIGGNLSVDGTINAGGGDAVNYQATGGGAGGSIWVIAKDISSTSSNPIFIAWGGDNYLATKAGSGGGGGRIAIYYDTLSGTMAFDMTHIRADGGQGDTGTNLGGAGTIYGKQSSQTYGNLYIASPWGTNSFYLETPFPQDAARTYASITIVGAKVKMLATSPTVTSAATTLMGNGGLSADLQVPTNGAAGYGSWFVPGTLSLQNSSTITEY